MHRGKTGSCLSQTCSCGLEGQTAEHVEMPTFCPLSAADRCPAAHRNVLCRDAHFLPTFCGRQVPCCTPKRALQRCPLSLQRARQTVRPTSALLHTEMCSAEMPTFCTTARQTVRPTSAPLHTKLLRQEGGSGKWDEKTATLFMRTGLLRALAIEKKKKIC